MKGVNGIGVDSEPRARRYPQELVGERPPAPELVQEDGALEGDGAHEREHRAARALVHGPAPRDGPGEPASNPSTQRLSTPAATVRMLAATNASKAWKSSVLASPG